MKVCVYTAIHGAHDELRPALPQTVDCDFICFTDQPDLPRDRGWRIIQAKRREAHPRMRAKFFKVLSHRAFPGGRLAWRHDPVAALLGRRPRYDALVWIDGCIQVTSPDFVASFVAHVGGTGWSMLRHPDRDCIYEEAIGSRGLRKYDGQPLEDQVAAYRAEGFPAHHGLMACTVIARRTDAPALAALNEAWWRENLEWTYQDQISLPVVLWRRRQGYDPVELNLWDNPWFSRLDHRTEL